MYKNCINIVASNICNNNCIICPVSWNKAPSLNPEPQVVVNKINKQLVSKSGLIAFTGGEPTLNPHLFYILKAVGRDSHEREIFLLTNGRKFSSSQYAAKLARLNINNFKIAIPVHGHNPRIHDRITKVKGSFKETIRGVNNLSHYNSICLEIRIVINKINAPHLLGISKFLIENFPNVNYIVFIAMDMEGEALKNSRQIFSAYREFMPNLNLALEYLGTMKKNVRLYHFPLCVLKSSFWPLAWNSLEKKDVCLLPQCRSCELKDYCPKIMKTYKRFKGKSEFKPVKLKNFYIVKPAHSSMPLKGAFCFDKVNSYRDNDYAVFSSSLPDFLAVKNGLKPLARFECSTIKDFIYLKKISERSGIFTELSKKKILIPGPGSIKEKNDPRNGVVRLSHPATGTFYAYASRDRALVTHYSRFDPELTLHPSTKKEEKKFAQALGYPSCCIDSYLNQATSIFKNKFLNLQTYSFYVNNFLRNISNYYLSFHNPCHGGCKKTIEYNSEIFKCIRREIPVFSRYIKNTLTRPLLLFVPKTSFNYDQRIVIFFDGALTLERNHISYSNCHILKSDSFTRRMNDELITDLFEFRRAQRAIISDEKIELFRNGIKVHSIRQSDKFNISFIRFDDEKN